MVDPRNLSRSVARLSALGSMPLFTTPYLVLAMSPRLIASQVHSLLRLILFVALTLPIAVFAQAAPKLASVTPEDGATLVPTTASLVFVFDQEMDTSVLLFQSIPNALAGNFEVTAPGFNQSLLASWGADKRSITLKAAIQFPYATFTWRLNPSGSIFPLKSKAGVLLPTITGTFATGIGGTVPVLVSSSPPNDSIEVNPTAFVSFNFDQPMKTNTAIAGNPPSVPAAVAWSGTGLDVTKFRYSWSLNGRSLLCDYVGDLPTRTEIRWELNPASAPVKLENPAGKVIPSGTYAGSFTTGSGIPCNTPTQPPDQGSFSLYKTSSFLQSSPAPPVPMSEDGSFIFGAIVQGSSLGPVPTTGTLTPPSGTPKPLSSITGIFLQSQELLPTEEALEAAAPAGPYTFQFQLGTQAVSTATMQLPAANPPVPQITNFEAAQAIRFDAEFTLSWNPFTGAGANDYVAVSIFDDRGRIRFSAPDPCIPRELLPTATSVVIPAKSFPTNASLSGILVFTRNFYYSTNAVPKMVGYGAITRTTQFSLQTTGGGGTVTPPTPARLSNPHLLPNGNPQFDVTGTPGATYSIQRGSRLGIDATWTTVVSLTLDASGRGTAEDTQANRTLPAFYRAVAP